MERSRDKIRRWTTPLEINVFQKAQNTNAYAGYHDFVSYMRYFIEKTRLGATQPHNKLTVAIGLTEMGADCLRGNLS